MNAEALYDVCVVGGGPAGAAISQILSRLGHRVLVVESSPFPRQHVGESLPPSIWPLLVELQVDQEVTAANFATSSGAWVRWGKSLERQRHGGMGLSGMQVDRGLFDLILLNRARDAGAEICQPGLAGCPKWSVENNWTIPVQTPIRNTFIRARHLVDASGRKAWLKVRRNREHVRTLALCSYWTSASTDFETQIEAGDDYWLWAAPLEGGKTSVAVIVDHATVRAGSSSGGSRNVESLHDQIVESSLRSRNLVTSRTQSVKSCDATPFLAADAAGPHWTIVGDSALSLDPLSSQGVQAAIASGIRSAAVVNTCLRIPENSNVALEFHNARNREAFAKHQTWSQEVYSRASQSRSTPFWRIRGAAEDHTLRLNSALDQFENARTLSAPLSLNSILGIADQCEVISMPVVRDHLVERSEAVVSAPGRNPVAFLENVEIAPIIRQLQRSHQSVAEVCRWLYSQGCFAEPSRAEPIRVLGALVDLGILKTT